MCRPVREWKNDKNLKWSTMPSTILFYKNQKTIVKQL